jgi:hypothetical protein
MRLIRYMCINFLVIAFEKWLIRHMYIDLLEIAFEKRLIRHMYIIFIGKLSSFPAKRRMHMHFALPRVAFAYTWSRKAQHSIVSRSDFECFPIEYCTRALVWLRSRRENNLGGGVSELSANLALLTIFSHTLLHRQVEFTEVFELLPFTSVIRSSFLAPIS